MRNSFAVILNAGSGGQAADIKLQKLRSAFALHNLVPEIFLAHGGEAIVTCTQKALELGYTMVVAAGGDGTVNTVAAEILGKNITLGILPLGTFNHLAKDLGIPQELDNAIKVLISGQAINVDACQVNQKVFINNSSIGLYAKLVRLRQKHQRLGKNKLTAGLASLIGVLGSYSYYKVRVEINGRDMALRSPFVFVGNNKYQLEGLNIGRREIVNNNELSVYVMRHSSRFGLIRLAWRALFGGLAEHPDFDVYSAKSAQIDTKKKFLPVALDGEVITLATPLKYTILPGALKIMAP